LEPLKLRFQRLVSMEIQTEELLLRAECMVENAAAAGNMQNAAARTIIADATITTTSNMAVII